MNGYKKNRNGNKLIRLTPAGEEYASKILTDLNRLELSIAEQVSEERMRLVCFLVETAEV